MLDKIPFLVLPGSFTLGGVVALQGFAGDVVIPNWVLGLLIAIIGWFLQMGIKQVRTDIKDMKRKIGICETRIFALELRKST